MPVSLNENTFNKTSSISTVQEICAKNLPASNSGRTLSELLAISHPDDLNSYTIHSVTPSAWRNREVVVAFSREGGVEFHKKRADDLEREKASLKDKLRQVHQDLEILVEWQTANLILHAFAEFAWNYVSIPDKTELNSYDMFDCKASPRLGSLITYFVCHSSRLILWAIWSKFPQKKCSHENIREVPRDSSYSYGLYNVVEA